MLKIQKNIPLKNFTTFQIGGEAKYFCIIKSIVELKEAVDFSKGKKLPIFVLGGGSNVLVSDSGYSGLVIKNEILGKKIEEGRLVTCSGETLDEVIKYGIKENLFGLENLSGIPGTVGGAIVQNAGAYGVEIKNCIYSVVGMDISSGENFIYYTNDCQFDYRTSIFKKNKNLIITEVQFKLNREFIPQIEYSGIKKLLVNDEIIGAEGIRDVVLKIRGEKLPDWHKLGTAGSFFKNPIFHFNEYEKIKEKFPKMSVFIEPGEKVKVPLAWVLDNICGLRGYREGNVGLYDKQPLILVNYGNATEKEVCDFVQKIKKIVREKTEIEIEEEVEKIN